MIASAIIVKIRASVRFGSRFRPARENELASSKLPSPDETAPGANKRRGLFLLWPRGLKVRIAVFHAVGAGFKSRRGYVCFAPVV